MGVRQERRDARQRARDAGEKFYYAQPCEHGHDGKRYTSSAGCVTCAGLRDFTKPTPGTNKMWEDAKAAGTVHFQGKPCEKCGTTLRYTSHNKCVNCHTVRQASRSPEEKRTRKYPADYYRRCHLRRKYGFKADEYEIMYKSQSGKCSICGEHRDKLVIDHCHTTGSVRELLCHSCNQGIGSLREDPAIFLAAIEYIRKHAAIEAGQDPGSPEALKG